MVMSVMVMGKAVLLFDIWLHYEVILFTPRWLVGVIPWTRKAQKNHTKEDSNK